MANNKLHGYRPKVAKGNVGVPYGEDLRFVNQNPHEFRKGMDYELTSLGCSRLQESTPEEREKATEKVLKNLEGNGGYYTSVITYETLFRNVQGSKPSFASWVKEQDNVKMQEVKRGDNDSKHKEDKMTEPKINKIEDVKADLKVSALKEAIKRRIKAKLFEKKDNDEDEAFDDAPDVDKQADKAGKNVEKGMARFEDEKKAIDELLFGESIPLSDKQRAKGEAEISKENPAEGSLLFRKNESLDIYRADKDVDAYKNIIKLNDAEIKSLEAHVEKFGAGKEGKGLGNNVTLDVVKGDDLPTTIKKLEARKVEIDKEIQDELTQVGIQRNEIAATDMTRADQLNLLEIIRANGISLREGSDSIRHYYEIAKTSFLEGLAKGLKL